MNKHLLVPANPTNPLVFLDIKIGQEYAGRIIIELRADVVPKTAENFRGLCTGEYGVSECGKALHYQGIRFHKVKRLFVVHSGDIVANDGTSGVSIYGKVFDDENFILPHDEGVVSMVNYGKPNTNNSQFVITSIPCANLDGSNVVVGKVLRGFGVVRLMEEFADVEGDPTHEIIITKCGQLKMNVDWGLAENDDVHDIYPLYPSDWYIDLNALSLINKLSIVVHMRMAGNKFYKAQRYYDARRKYRKAIRYYNALEPRNDEEVKLMETLFIPNHLNMATVEIKLGEYANAVYEASEVLRIQGDNAKAFLRRGQAHLALSNLDEAVSDLKSSYAMEPGCKLIKEELDRAIEARNELYREQRKRLKNVFNDD